MIEVADDKTAHRIRARQLHGGTVSLNQFARSARSFRDPLAFRASNYELGAQDCSFSGIK